MLIIFTVLGVIIPYAAFIPFLVQDGLDIPLAVQQAAANRMAAFAWLDVLVSAVVLLTVAFGNKQISPKQALAVTLLTCVAGVSAGLPLLFYFLLCANPSVKA